MVGRKDMPTKVGTHPLSLTYLQDDLLLAWACTLARGTTRSVVTTLNANWRPLANLFNIQTSMGNAFGSFLPKQSPPHIESLYSSLELSATSSLYAFCTCLIFTIAFVKWWFNSKLKVLGPLNFQ